MALQPGPRAPRGRGFFLVELLVGILILTLAVIPLYQMFVTSSRTMFYSKLSYMAMHTAREELEELRQIPFPKIRDAEVAHDWTPVSGRLLARTLKYRQKDGQTSKFDQDEYDYPKEYQRIETKLEIQECEPPSPRMKRAIVMVRWQEMGESPKELGDLGERVALSRFETILASQDVDLQP
ncbi:MAG: hypothetical protein HY814_04580 [Candidatus Riflebacteria bacterium]|nr:hypothetical protein [Candidatus Riflebacteria bacterium]